MVKRETGRKGRKENKREGREEAEEVRKRGSNQDEAVP